MKRIVPRVAWVLLRSPRLFSLLAISAVGLTTGTLAGQEVDLGLGDDLDLNFDIEPEDPAPTGGEIASIVAGAAIAMAIVSALAAIPFSLLLRRVPQPQRLISQSQIWLLTIPGWNLFWSFVVAGAVNRSYRNALMARALTGGLGVKRSERASSESIQRGSGANAARSAVRVPSATLGQLWGISFALSFAAVGLPYMFGYMWPTGLVWLGSVVLLTQYYRSHSVLRDEVSAGATEVRLEPMKRAA